MSYARLKTAAIVSACVAALTDEEALERRSDAGLDGAFDVALARGLHAEQLSRIRRLHRLASDTHDPTMWVSADDYDTIAAFYEKGS